MEIENLNQKELFFPFSKRFSDYNISKIIEKYQCVFFLFFFYFILERIQSNASPSTSLSPGPNPSPSSSSSPSPSPSPCSSPSPSPSPSPRTNTNKLSVMSIILYTKFFRFYTKFQENLGFQFEN